MGEKMSGIWSLKEKEVDRGFTIDVVSIVWSL